jgi:hypothetical protein
MEDELAWCSTGSLIFEDEQVKFNGVAVHVTAVQRAILKELADSGESGINSVTLAARIRPGLSPEYRNILKSHMWQLRRKLRGLPTPRPVIIGGSGHSLYRLGWSQETASEE